MIGFTITQISLVTVNIYCFCNIYKHLQVHNSWITSWKELQTYLFWKQFVFCFFKTTYYDVLHMYLYIWCDIIHMYLCIHTNVSTYIHNAQHMYGMYELYHWSDDTLISLVFLPICFSAACIHCILLLTFLLILLFFPSCSAIHYYFLYIWLLFLSLIRKNHTLQ